MYDTIQISQEQARDMLHDANIHTEVHLQDSLQNWQNMGYIRKTPMDEAEEWFFHTACHFAPAIHAQVQECRRLYMTVIRELQDRLVLK